MLNPKNNNNMNNILKHEYKKYSRQIILQNIGIHGQYRLKKSSVLIIGAGGLGCPAILYLAHSGIGHIGIIDSDSIDYSNLNRQILYNDTHISQLKSDIAKQSIKNCNQQCKLKTYNIKLDKYNSYSIIKLYDIILDCTDNFETRYIIDQVCFDLHKPHIYGAIQQFEGHISVFNYKNGIRYSDIYTNLDTENVTNNTCTNLGVIGVITGTIGILQATEAIKIILGIGKIITDKLLTYNLLNTKFQAISLIKNNKPVSYTHLRAHETRSNLVCRLLLEKHFKYFLSSLLTSSYCPS